MTDRPDLNALFDAVRMHIEAHLLPLCRPEPRLYFQTLVALNLLKIGQRELASGAELQRVEWQRLNELLHDEAAMPAHDAALANALEVRRRDLCRAIRAGKYDSTVAADALMSHLDVTVFAELTLNNPGLASRMASEIAN